MQINRKDFVQELLLRKAVRKAIHAVNERKEQYGQEENHLRGLIKTVIQEQEQVGRDSTGVEELDRTLHSFVENMGEEYSTLKTGKEQRVSFREHVLKFVENLLEEIDGILNAGGTIEEAIGLDIEDEDKFIEVRPEKLKQAEEEEAVASEESGLEPIEGLDPTGHARATDFFKGQMKTNISTAYTDLKNPQDRAVFKEWMMINLKIYFTNFEEENFGVPQTDIPEPPPGSETGAAPPEAPLPPPEEGLPPLPPAE